MIVAVVVGSRKRSSTKGLLDADQIEEATKDDKFILRQVLISLNEKYKGSLRVVSYACDDGIGKLVKDLCIEMRLKMAELIWFFHGEERWDTHETAKAYVSRNPSLMELGDMFVILPDEDRWGIVEDLVHKVTTLKNTDNDRPYVVMNDRGECVEEHKKVAIL